MQTKALFKKHPVLPWVLMAPQGLIILVFIYWPALQSLASSLLRQNAFGTQVRFVGLQNFVSILSDPSYIGALGTTLVFALGVVLLSQMGGLFFAHLLFYSLHFKRLSRSLVILPYALSAVTVGVLWRFLFAPYVGILTVGLAELGIVWNHSLKAGQALSLVIFASSWQRIAYCTLYYLAGYHALPQSILEASLLDCGSVRRFFSLTLPLLRPTSFFLLVVNTIFAFFETFGTIDILTQGGPGVSTSTLVYKIYNDGYVNQNMGSASAQSVLLIIMVTGLMMLQFRHMERGEL